MFLLVFGMWGKTGINIFVFITGYFMCKQKITKEKFFRLLLEVYFYKFLIYIIFLLSGYNAFSFLDLFNVLFPFPSVSYDFTSCYLLFYLFIPFLNITINNLNEKQHIKLIALSLFVYTILGTIPKINVVFNYVTWFIVLFFVASYIRLYPKDIYFNKKVINIITLVLITLSITSVIVMSYVGVRLGRPGLSISYYFVSDSNKILALLTAIASFLCFKNMEIKYNKWINKIASSTFGVLLIHANSNTMRQWLWKDTLNNVGAYNSNYTVLHAVASTLCIFILCSLIDILRIKFIERPIVKVLDSKFSNKQQANCGQ